MTTRLIRFAACTFFALLWGPLAANEWEARDYIGAWKNNNRLQKFPHAEWITFELWEGADGLPTGVAMFVKGGNQRCIGKISTMEPDPARGIRNLRFDPIASQDCETAVGGFFRVSRWRPKSVVTMLFVPDDEPDAPQLILTNTAHFFKLQETPTELEPVVKLARNGSGDLENELAEAKVAQDVVMTSLRETLKEGFNWEVIEAELIGAWQGVIVDSRDQYPAEFALWSGTRYPFQYLYGAIRFEDERIGTATIQVRSGPGMSSFQLGAHGFSRTGNAEPTKMQTEAVSGVGTFQINATGTALALRFRRLQTTRGRLSNEYCVPGMSTEGEFSECHIAGVFVRSNPSAELREDLAGVAWDSASPGPAKDYWELLSHGEAGLAELRTLHAEGLKLNQKILAEMDRKQKERERREREALLAERRAQAAEKLRRSQRPTTSYPPGTRRPMAKPLPPLPKLPQVSGPFDGLRGGDFLNALYDGNLEVLAQFDNYYQIRKIRQQRSVLGDHLFAGLYEAAFQQVRLADTVLAMYLFNYQSIYGSCIRDDAANFRVVEVLPDIVYENLLGIEVARFYGGTTTRHYKVNKEFVTAFRRIGTTKPEGAMSTISDFLLNGGGTDLRRELLAGTRQMMRRHSCDSEIIQRVEKTLLLFSTR